MQHKAALFAIDSLESPAMYPNSHLHQDSVFRWANLTVLSPLKVLSPAETPSEKGGVSKTS